MLKGARTRRLPRQRSGPASAPSPRCISFDYQALIHARSTAGILIAPRFNPLRCAGPRADVCGTAHPRHAPSPLPCLPLPSRPRTSSAYQVSFALGIPVTASAPSLQHFLHLRQRGGAELATHPAAANFLVLGVYPRAQPRCRLRHHCLPDRTLAPLPRAHRPIYTIHRPSIPPLQKAPQVLH